MRSECCPDPLATLSTEERCQDRHAVDGQLPRGTGHFDVPGSPTLDLPPSRVACEGGRCVAHPANSRSRSELTSGPAGRLLPPRAGEGSSSQNRKYLCAIGSRSAGSQTSSTPSAVTA